ncbi:MAG: phosphate ABC transporter permease PstA [Candidatus Brocadiia bacterium]
MRLSTRKVLDRSFSGLGILSLVLMGAALAVLLVPIFARGIRAVVFRETVERREFIVKKMQRGDRAELERELALAGDARRPVFQMLEDYESEGWETLERLAERNSAPEHVLKMIRGREQGLLRAIGRYEMAQMWAGRDPGAGLEELKEQLAGLEPVKAQIRELLGALPGDDPQMPRDIYGASRWDRAQAHLERLLYRAEYRYDDPDAAATKLLHPRAEEFRDTALEPLFGYFEQNLTAMLRPQWTFYWRFWFDRSYDAYFFGGIWAEVLGTLYLTIGAMVVAAPVGVISAVYLAEYAGDSRFVSLIRICISTLAGVPSVVFGLFGVAFFIRFLPVMEGRSVLVGSLVLALLVLPTVIRASEEAIKAVPRTYKEASLSLGATRWRTIVKVILPASLPGIITSVIISMGRAAGETAPILFTAVVALGPALKPWEAFTTATPALPSNIYSIVAEHEAVEEIIHVPYGMVLTLVSLVLVLNLAAILLRARISRKLRG